MRNLKVQVKKAFCYQKLFWPFTVWINCSSDLKIFANSQPSASNFKSFSLSLGQFFLTVGQNNFGNKIPFLMDANIFACTWKWINIWYIFFLLKYLALPIVTELLKIKLWRWYKNLRKICSKKRHPYFCDTGNWNTWNTFEVSGCQKKV